MTRADMEAGPELAAFFAAARADAAEPSAALLNAIAADAAEVSAARAPAATPPRHPARPWPERVRALLEPIGGWRTAGALGLSAAIGFWAGMSGTGGLDPAALVSGQAAADSAADPVADFFDLASVEG